ncbi:MAG: biotin biosynthesis protein BioH [Gammaproteobacteria bacterium]|jgi:pimeloyl-[acyl-carrier protein] methyl ester esterase|nr:biotin biosynthesis protein BioH [Gammaproteobacteria bacterium]
MMTNLLHLNVVGKGPPLILLHGWGWHGGIWSPLIPHLVDKFQLFIPDLPGFGKSSIFTTDYSFEALAACLFEHIPQKAIWVGWSLGGLVAWWVALHYPKKVSRLITVAASPKFMSEENWPGIPLATLEKFARDITIDDEKTLTHFLALQLRGSPHSEILRSELQKHFLRPHKDALAGGLRLLLTTDLRVDLPNMTIPSLHIFGSLDTIVPVSVVDCLKPLLRNSQCEIIRRTGHMPFLTHYKEFLNYFE